MSLHLQVLKFPLHLNRVPIFTPVGVMGIGLCLLILLTVGCTKKPSAKAGEQKPKVSVSVPLPEGKAWAVVVGAGQYEHAAPVRYAREDAKALEGILAGQGFTVSSLYDQAATKAAVETMLAEVLGKRAGPGDRVVIFFAGRGETRSASGGKKDFLLPIDAELGDVPQTGIALEQIRALVETSPARHVLLIVATNLGGFEGPPMAEKADLRAETAKRLAAQSGAHIVTAAAPEQTPLDVTEWDHGLFTHYLLEGLGKAEADANRDGVVLTSELVTYLEQNIMVASQIRGHKQQPQFWALTAGEGEMLFIPTRQRGELPAISPDTPGGLAVRELETELRGLEQNLEELEAMMPKGGSARNEDGAHVLQQIKATKKQIEAARVRYLQARLLAAHDMMGQDGARMVLVPAGEFFMGEDTKQYAVGDPSYNYAPPHTVYLDGFYIDKHEVTAGLYAKFLDETNRPAPRFWTEMQLKRDSQRPVIGVVWDDANAYCQWAGKRLPTEAEWEKAARGTDGRKYPWGNEKPKRSLASYDWYGVSTWQGYQTLTPVGSYEAGTSPYGALDMAGSVWEWVADWYGRNYYKVSPKENPKGPQKGKERVVRGGSWRHPPELLRAAYRHRYQPSVLPFTYLGFRCAQGLPTQGETLQSENVEK